MHFAHVCRECESLLLLLGFLLNRALEVCRNRFHRERHHTELLPSDPQGHESSDRRLQQYAGSPCQKHTQALLRSDFSRFLRSLLFGPHFDRLSRSESQLGLRARARPSAEPLSTNCASTAHPYCSDSPTCHLGPCTPLGVQSLQLSSWTVTVKPFRHASRL